MSRFLIALIMSFTLTATAHAADPKLLSTHGDWAVYTFSEAGKKVCYMASQPKKAEGNYTRRGDIFAFITHRPGENAKNVFSYITGYTFKSGASVDLTIDRQTFDLFSQKDMAWARLSETDQKIANAVRKGSKMVVKGVSSRGTKTTDTYSLKGSSAAHDAMNRACNM